MSSTIEPRASCTGMPAPIAAAIGSSIRYTSRAPADSADSLIARRSTWVEPHGTQTSTRGLGRNMRERCTLRMNCLSISSVIEKSAMTPSFSGRTRDDVAGRAAEHALGLGADGGDRSRAAWTAVLADGDDRGLVQHDALAAHVNQGVGGAEIDR